MGRVILTGLTKNKHHDFSLDYIEVGEEEKCIVNCRYGFDIETINFRNYGGTKDLQIKWEKYVHTWKGWA